MSGFDIFIIEEKSVVAVGFPPLLGIPILSLLSSGCPCLTTLDHDTLNEDGKAYEELTQNDFVPFTLTLHILRYPEEALWFPKSPSSK